MQIDLLTEQKKIQKDTRRQNALHCIFKMRHTNMQCERTDVDGTIQSYAKNSRSTLHSFYFASGVFAPTPRPGLCPWTPLKSGPQVTKTQLRP